ncbi:MAG: alpha/beta fold hydrolase [Alphaproteobacteria bacterium]|nr:alpha/beta fold hydrolase [Alphaproteobacteria bacterium]
MDLLPAPPLPDRIARQLPPGVRRHTVRVGDHALHLMEAGEGRPVLLMHGNPTWSFLYRKVFAALAGEPLRLIAPDLVGLGLSDRVPGRWHTLERHGAVIADLVAGLDLRDVVLVGQDWGGPIGLHAFVRQRERLAGLVVLNTVIGPPRPGFRPTAFHRFARTPVVSDLAFRLGAFPQRALHTAQGDRASIRGEVAWAYRWPLRGLARNAAPLALARMVPDREAHPTVPALREVGELVAGWTGPAAIVWGDRDPVLGRLRRHVERTLPHASVRATQAGHFLQEEVPEDIAAAVREVAAAADGRTA